jgi:hypothetical protein
MNEGEVSTMGTLTELVPVHLPNGAVVRVEVRATGSPERLVAGGYANLDLDKVRHAIEGIASLIVSAFEKVRPRKASAEFGIEIGMEASGLTALLVKGTGKANLKVTLEWSAGQARAPEGRDTKAPESTGAPGG